MVHGSVICLLFMKICLNVINGLYIGTLNMNTCVMNKNCREDYCNNNIVNTMSDMQCFEKIKYILQPLIHNLHWTYLRDSDSFTTQLKSFCYTIYLSKPCFELEEITISFYPNKHIYHFSLPITNSIYNYYTKIHGFESACHFLENYVSTITTPCVN